MLLPLRCRRLRHRRLCTLDRVAGQRLTTARARVAVGFEKHLPPRLPCEILALVEDPGVVGVSQPELTRRAAAAANILVRPTR